MKAMSFFFLPGARSYVLAAAETALEKGADRQKEGSKNIKTRQD